LRVLEEALIAFPGMVLVVSHDRYFLNRVCTNILAFEGDGKIAHSVGDYDYYLEKKERTARESARQSAAFLSASKPGPAPKSPNGTKARKLSFKEQRELDGMEAQIHAVEAEVARIEGLFADPEFFRKQAAQVNQLTADLEAAKENVTKLYARWEALETIRTASAS